MNVTSHAMRLGMSRGRTEFSKSLRAPADLGYYVVGTVVFLVVMFLNRDNEVEGAGLTLGMLLLPGVLGMVIVFGAAYGVATALATEREDGTLLRAKSVPHGMVGYVTGQVTRTSLEIVFNLTVLLVPAMIILDSLLVNGVRGAVLVVAIVVLGLTACVPLGLVVGSVFRNPRSVGGWGMLVMGGLISISGVFAPIEDLPGWLQPIGQVFPMYWLGLGLRSAMLPESAVTFEIGESWRHLETFGVLGLWAVVGLALAPVLLRRMARRESGSAVAARRDVALKRV